MHQPSDYMRQRLARDLHHLVRGQGWTECRRQWACKSALVLGFVLADAAPKARQTLPSCGPWHIPADCLHIDGNQAEYSGVFRTILYLRRKMLWLLFAMLYPFSAYALGTGGTDSVSAWTYIGWACDPATPGYQSEVQAKRDDGEFLGRIIAANPREAAVPSACRSPHSAHGFRLDVEQKPEWADGKSHDVSLYSVDPNGNATPFGTFSVKFPRSTDGIAPPHVLPAVMMEKIRNF